MFVFVSMIFLNLLTLLIGTLNLAHFSVKEYLMSDEIKSGAWCQFYLEESLAEEFIARSCIAYLLQFDKDEFPPEIVDRPSLVEYAARYWVWHAQSTSMINSTPPDHLLLRLFQPSSKVFYNWIRLHDIDDIWQEHTVLHHSRIIPDCLYYSSLAGFMVIVDVLLREGAKVNAQGGQCSNSLQAASHAGHLEIVCLLIKKGAEVNAQGGYYGNALQAASGKGHLEIVLLIYLFIIVIHAVLFFVIFHTCCGATLIIYVT